MKGSQILKKKVHFYEKKKFYEKEALAAIKIRMQLIMNKENLLVNQFENYKTKVLDLLKAEHKVKEFKEDKRNMSFINYIMQSEASNASQTVKIFKGRKVNDISIMTTEELDRLQSPSVLSQRSSFHSDRALSRDSSAKRLPRVSEND